jgi:uncharacterized membrane protein YfcA
MHMKLAVAVVDLAGTVVGKRVLAHVLQSSFRQVVCVVLVATGVFVLARFVLQR